MFRTLALPFLILLFSGSAIADENGPVNPSEQTAKAREDLAYSVGVQAYIYGFATVELYRSLYEQTLDPDRGHTIGVNEFNHVRSLAAPQDTWVVTPNNDALYSRVWLDLSEEPLILSIPPISDRFFVFPIGDFYHDATASLGWWNVGSGGGHYALTAAGWQGVLPDGVEQIEVSTPLCWMLPRTLTTGDPEDLEQVNALQDQFTLTPLSQWGKEEPTASAIGREYPTWNNNDPLNYFAILNEMLRFNPPRPADAGIVATFKEIGVHPSQQFDSDSVDEAVRRGLLRAIDDAKNIIATTSLGIGEMINGWLYIPGPKEFGTDYLFRAALESVALLHGESEMQVGYIGNLDGQGNLLNGQNNYEIKFDVPPPVLGFWSLTMYDGIGKNLVDNSINRYSIGDRTTGITYGQDGSLTIYISNEMPGGSDGTNWLPAPEGPFYVVIRAYNAEPSIFNGSWLPPPVLMTE